MERNSADQKNTGSKFLYFQLSNEERESAVYYLLESILKARDEDPGLARAGFFDEDVNIYLAHLLFAMSLPEYHDMADPFLSDDPNEVIEWAKQAEDPMLRYFIYKANADNMLIHSTIFVDKLPEVKRAIFRKHEHGAERFAVVYYNQASRCHKGIYQKKTGVGEVLEKISGHFELYQRLLYRIKGDYFKFIDCFRDEAFRHFFMKMKHYEKQCRKDMIMDEFLELYHLWRVSAKPDLKQKVIYLARELSSIDPKFRFDISKLDPS